MLNTNWKTLRIVLSCLVFFAPSYLLPETSAQGQTKKEPAQPVKPSDSSPQIGQAPTVSTTPTGSIDDPNSEIIRQMLKRIEQLETRIRELEARQNTTGGVAECNRTNNDTARHRDRSSTCSFTDNYEYRPGNPN
jgi:hypothetical protein